MRAGRRRGRVRAASFPVGDKEGGRARGLCDRGSGGSGQGRPCMARRSLVTAWELGASPGRVGADVCRRSWRCGPCTVRWGGGSSGSSRCCSLPARPAGGRGPSQEPRSQKGGRVLPSAQGAESGAAGLLSASAPTERAAPREGRGKALPGVSGPARPSHAGFLPRRERDGPRDRACRTTAQPRAWQREYGPCAGAPGRGGGGEMGLQNPVVCVPSRRRERGGRCRRVGWRGLS